MSSGHEVWYEAPAWEERYAGDGPIFSGRVNPQLVQEVSDLPPGSALDAGCGEGADVFWLAGRGWRVTGADFSAVVLRQNAARAAALGDDIATRTEWVHADLRSWDPPRGQYDLVTSHFVHQPGEAGRAFFRRLASAVAPGGQLLVVLHSPLDLATTMGRPDLPEGFWTAGQIAASLDLAGWEVITSDARPRPALDPGGREITIHDTVFRARRG
ncbi:class I SAM-dependent methyltransferase [Kineosporia sp. J2-2]|uniref:Class I SAM-dependent methyltransferase n=1 Tax=Kineosporia corallincola TaxID=2835133 RepID=A0ABS5TPW3_9ACTN|nr:class I SAM-dependent methyltransferase [Kineosporia corallincola]MBT0772394.1 class I SAM-dependent methyltransferase [Kineosporia corallincola]